MDTCGMQHHAIHNEKMQEPVCQPESKYFAEEITQLI